MKLTPTRIILAAAALVFLALLLLAIPRASIMLEQQRAITGLKQVARAAVQRIGDSECFPAFGFDSQGPQWAEEVAGPAFFGRVTDIVFRKSDDRQVVDSIVYMERLEPLNRIMFYSAPSESVVAKVRDALPGISLVDRSGVPLP